MQLKDNSLELLSPCKDLEIGMAAISHGADAVYVGGPSFSARANAGNSISEIAKLVDFAHRYRSRVYLALNTIMTDKELEEAVKIAHDAWNAGVDALIVQDMGLLMCDLPPIQLHASTQCDIRTPAKAKFLESVGFSQVVLARELDLAQIQEIHQSLSSARIEHFVHGALCVSFSGQCYASQVLKGRSANRGACAQICRLPFDVYDQKDNLLLQQNHVLSLRDNNQTNNLEALVQAGVRSFKIEGRYKDLDYVKNVTAHYRKKLDSFIENHPEFQKSSEGNIEFSFPPDIKKSFNRGSTDYFTHGRTDSMANFQTPKSSGEVVGTVAKLEGNSVVVNSKKSFNNGDGLTFLDENGQLQGFLVNKAEKASTGNAWILNLREGQLKHLSLKPGQQLMRNKDVAWQKLLDGETALRKIPLSINAEVTGNQLSIRVTDEEGNTSEIRQEGEFSEAKTPGKALENFKKSLGKLGNTEYFPEAITVKEDVIRFFPASYVNDLRRQLVAELSEKRQAAFPVLEPSPKDKLVPYPEKELDYKANVLNKKAREFYELHGATIKQLALEKTSSAPKEPIEVMRCKYCIRREIKECPKEAVKEGRKVAPAPLKLKSGAINLEARFDCKKCEMSIFANPQ